MPRHRKPTLASSNFFLSLSDNKLHQFGTALPISFSSAIAAMSLASHVHVSKLVDAPIPSQLISRPPWHAPASGITAVLRGWPVRARSISAVLLWPQVYFKKNCGHRSCLRCGWRAAAVDVDLPAEQAACCRAAPTALKPES